MNNAYLDWFQTQTKFHTVKGLTFPANKCGLNVLLCDASRMTAQGSNLTHQTANMAGQEDPVQREIHQDWANREYIEVITSSIKKIADFLNSFGKLLNKRGLEYSRCDVEYLSREIELAAANTDVDVFKWPLPVSI